MKRFCIAGLVALSLGLSTSAMAKDLDSVDVFVGDFVGVMRVDFNKLIANKMISDAVDQGIKSVFVIFVFKTPFQCFTSEKSEPLHRHS